MQPKYYEIKTRRTFANEEIRKRVIKSDYFKEIKGINYVCMYVVSCWELEQNYNSVVLGNIWLQ